MSPLPIHERWKRIIGRFIEDMSLEHNIPIASLGSTTWKRSDLKKGLEGDECYYVQREPLVREKLHIDLERDPPPDLALEIDMTHNPVDRDGVCAALGVAEIWHYDGESLRAAALIEDAAGKRYQPLMRSLAFPFLDPRDLEPFIAMLGEKDETSIVRAWREHIRESEHKRGS
jgi:Uma2 family endonuclease